MAHDFKDDDVLELYPVGPAGATSMPLMVRFADLRDAILATVKDKLDVALAYGDGVSKRIDAIDAELAAKNTPSK